MHPRPAIPHEIRVEIGNLEIINRLRMCLPGRACDSHPSTSRGEDFVAGLKLLGRLPALADNAEWMLGGDAEYFAASLEGRDFNRQDALLRRNLKRHDLSAAEFAGFRVARPDGITGFDLINGLCGVITKQHGCSGYKTCGARRARGGARTRHKRYERPSNVQTERG